MKTRLILFTLAACFASGQSGFEPPVLGQIRDSAGRLIRISGSPGAWQAEEVAGGREWIENGWRIEPTPAALSLIRESNGERYLLPAVVQDLQLAVFVPPAQETVVAGSFAFPMTAVGDASEVRFRVRNMGTAIIEVNRVFIAPGGPFRVSNAFPIPRTLAPGAFGEIRVEFAPQSGGSFSGELKINDTVWKLSGSSQDVPELEVYEGQSWTLVATASALDFGRIQPGQQIEKWFRFTMPPAEPPSLAGSGFTLDWFGEGFRVTCRPATPGNYSAKLSLGPRSWNLIATGEQVPQPSPSFLQLPVELESGSQQRVEIMLTSPASAAGAGTLRMEFVPETATLGDDAAAAFLPSLSRSIGFTVNPGEMAAQFPEGAATIQTGSTAGWIVLRILFGPHTVEQRIRIAPSPVKFDLATATRSTNVAEVVLRGIDNTRTAQRIAFTFYRSNGSVAGSFDIDVGQAFAEYYAANAKTGGVFQLRAQFPVSGDSTQLESVEVSLTNQPGKCDTGRLRF